MNPPAVIFGILDKSETRKAGAELTSVFPSRLVCFKIWAWFFRIDGNISLGLLDENTARFRIRIKTIGAQQFHWKKLTWTSRMKQSYALGVVKQGLAKATRSQLSLNGVSSASVPAWRCHAEVHVQQHGVSRERWVGPAPDFFHKGWCHNWPLNEPKVDICDLPDENGE